MDVERGPAAAGRAAWHAGRPACCCPHPAASPQALAWIDGFLAAARATEIAAPVLGSTELAARYRPADTARHAAR